MLRLSLIASFILICSAKIYDKAGLDDVEDLKDVDSIPEWETNPIWVLKLSGDNEIEMKMATPDEEEEFEEITAPSIESLKRKRATRKPSRTLKLDENEVDKKDILRFLNKFALHSNLEPDSNLMEAHYDGPSLTLYFKSPYTLLTVVVGNNQWNYFIDYSPMPSWFYEDHTLALDQSQSPDSVLIPEEITQQFYQALMSLLNTLLGFSTRV